MNSSEAKKLRTKIRTELITGRDIDDCRVLKHGWQGLLLDNYRFYDTQSGNVGDEYFQIISSITTELYGDWNVFLVTTAVYDIVRPDSSEPVPEVRFGPNSLEGYSQFKNDPELTEFYMFGESLKWVIYANSDWTVVACEPQCFERIIQQLGGLSAYLGRLDSELGLPNPEKEMTSVAAKWLDFIVRITRIPMVSIKEFWQAKEK